MGEAEWTSARCGSALGEINTTFGILSSNARITALNSDRPTKPSITETINHDSNRSFHNYVNYVCLPLRKLDVKGRISTVFFGNVTVERLFLQGDNMKLSALSSLGLAALLLAGTATAASALDFNFSFSTDCALTGLAPLACPEQLPAKLPA